MKTLTLCVLLSTGTVVMAENAHSDYGSWFQPWTDYRAMLALNESGNEALFTQPATVHATIMAAPTVLTDSANRVSAPSRVETVVIPSAPDSASNAMAPHTSSGAVNPDELRLNFRGAPIEMVLNYLSDAAGFIIQLNIPVQGKVDVWSNQSVTKEEAVDLLNSVLNRNGYAAVRNGRMLTIMSRDEALHGDIPVKISDDPNTIPKNDEIVTLIIPIRYVEAEQLVMDLSPLVSQHAMIVANEAGNSIVVTDTQANIRHLAEIIKAIDSSAEDVAEIRVFHLKHHDPVEVAYLLSGLFSEQSNAAGSQAPYRVGGQGSYARVGGGGVVALGGVPAKGAKSQNDRIKKRARVVAVPDQRTSSVVVTASKDSMSQIESMIEQIDQESPKVAHVSVIHLENADPEQVEQVLQSMFQNGNTARNASSQSSPLMNRVRLQSTGSSQGPALGGNKGLGNARPGAGASF